MLEPKLLARLDSIKRHLMSGMAMPYVIDEIECLQRDLEQEMKPNQDHDWVQPLEISLPCGRKVPYMMPIKYHTTPSLVIKIKSIGPTDEPEPAYDYIPGNGDILGTRKKHHHGNELKGVFTKTEDIYLDPPLLFDTRDYPMDAKILKTPQSDRFEGDIYRCKEGLVCKTNIDLRATQGDKHPLGVHGYTPPKSNCHEYADGPLQHFLIKPGTQGEKKPKDALGLGPY